MRPSFHSFLSWRHDILSFSNKVMITVGAWSPAEELPRTLQGIKDLCRSLILDKPMPEWWFEMLDMLDVCEDTMECHPVRVRKYDIFELVSRIS